MVRNVLPETSTTLEYWEVFWNFHINVQCTSITNRLRIIRNQKNVTFVSQLHQFTSMSKFENINVLLTWCRTSWWPGRSSGGPWGPPPAAAPPPPTAARSRSWRRAARRAGRGRPGRRTPATPPPGSETCTPGHSGKVWGQTRLLYIGSVDTTFVMVDSTIMI